MIGYRIWCGTEQDTIVGDFIRRHQKDIAITFESAKKENADVVFLKYNMEMEVKFKHNGWGKNDTPVGLQYTVARFHVPLMTSCVDETNVCDMVAQLMEKINHYRHLNVDWSIFQTNYLRLCWGIYRSPMEYALIPTPKWLALN